MSARLPSFQTGAPSSENAGRYHTILGTGTLVDGRKMAGAHAGNSGHVAERSARHFFF